MIRVLIADDHAIVRRGLKQIVADTPDIAVSPENLMFYGIPVGTTEYGVVHVRNEGSVTLHLESIQIDGAASFQVSMPDSAEVRPGAGKDLVVQFVASKTLDTANQDDGDKKQPIRKQQYQGYDDLGICPAGSANLPQPPHGEYY